MLQFAPRWAVGGDATCCRRVKDIASRILTIPADQRYTCRDMDEIANLLFGFR